MKKMAATTDAESADRASVDDLYQRLPRLDSEEYVTFVDTAPRSALPPEVLARAFRQLPLDSRTAHATIERLFRRTGTNWEYLQPVVRLARDRARDMLSEDRGGAEDIHQDLLQDALLRIIRVLPTPRGAFAEVAWTAFAVTQFKDAWRERYGRHAERLGPYRGSPVKPADAEDEDRDPLDLVSNEQSIWGAIVTNDQTAEIEATAERVAHGINDPFVRDVALAAWSSNDRPKTSGVAKPGQLPTLQERFPDKSRDQINRALRKADSLLATELLSNRNLTWSDDLRAMLEKQRERGLRS
jgi:DNA-directed RNA polymerase specialized sigma24 family protein